MKAALLCGSLFVSAALTMNAWGDEGKLSDGDDSQPVTVRVAAISLVPHKFDLAGNADRLAQSFRKAKQGGAQMAVAPEGALDGYVVNEIIAGEAAEEKMKEVAIPIDHKVIRRFQKLAKELEMCLVFGFAERIENDVFNCAVFIDDLGEIRGKYHKMQFAEGYDDSWWFNRLGQSSRAFDTPYGRCGIMICNDRWNADLARIAVLEEIDPVRRHSPEQLGPFFGTIGPVESPADPRNAELFVTTLESLAACPWRTFVERFLRVAPSPDPLLSLPGFTPLLIGAVVHEALDRLTCNSFREADAHDGEKRFELLMQDAPQGVAWPTESALREIISDSALAVMRNEGIAFAGFGPALAALALPLVQRAGALDWPSAPAALLVLGSEVRGTAPVSDATGRIRQLHFKADRVDRRNGHAVLTDYKTGTPISDRKTPSTRRKHLLNQIGSGQKLQTVAYARSAGSPGAEGRYLFLRETLDAEMASVSVMADDEEANTRFDSAVTTLLAALDQGNFLPRLSEPKGDRGRRRCEACEVSEACVRGDSVARARFERWAALQNSGGPRPEPERLLRDLWLLPIAGQE